MSTQQVAGKGDAARWPGWARRVVSVALLAHIVAILAAALATPPASPLELSVASLFRWHYDLIDQGYSYRYYAPEPPPTPVLEARLRYGDGRPEGVVRIPDRSLRPRMLYQRHLALANHAYEEWAQARGMPEEARPPLRWAASYARHLGRVHGCREVALYLRMHLIPPLGQVREALAEPGATAPDLDAEEFYAVPELMGVFACDAS